MLSTEGGASLNEMLSSAGQLQRCLLSAGAFSHCALFTITMLSAGMPVSHANGTDALSNGHGAAENVAGDVGL